MSQIHETNTMGFACAGAIAQYLRVILGSGNTVSAASASEVETGILEEAAFTAGDFKTVRLRTANGTMKMVANGAITLGADVYAAASGKIASSGTVPCGTALQAATTNGDVIEVLRQGLSGNLADDATGTTAATFTVDSDATTPKIALSGVALGTGNFTTTLTTESTLSGNNSITVPEADGDTLVAVALAQTVTTKTFTGCAGLALTDNSLVDWGTGNDARMLWSTGDASDHSLVLALGDTSQMLHITDKAAQATDWAVTSPTHPTIYVHSNTTPSTDYLLIGSHDGTTALVDVVGGTVLSLKLSGTQYASLQVTGLAVGTYVVAGSAAGTDQLTLKSTGTAPSGTGANVGHLFADFETDDDELFWLSGTNGTATQLTT
jgi:hypothetical protein